MAPPFLFDFTNKSPNVTLIENLEKVATFGLLPEKQQNLCPYLIPKLDDIVKDIERSAYQVDKHKFVSDLFECGAIAISNQVDLAQKRNARNGIDKLSRVIRPTCKRSSRRFSVKFMPCLPPSYMMTADSTTISASCL